MPDPATKPEVLASRGADLPPSEPGEQQHGQCEQRRKPGEPASVGIHQGQQQAEHTSAEEERPNEIQVAATRTAARGGRHEPGGQYEGELANRNIHVEHQPPGVGAVGRCQQQPTDHRTGRCGQPDRGAEEAERPGPLGTAEQVLDQGGVLREQHAASNAL
jgi:hypothetical protein